jgi:hypothetical protein
LLGSITVLALVLGGLYLGWYRWPGWYLTGALSVVPILVGVDVALGPLVTLVIASPAKSVRELSRDIALIVIVQMTALAYGTHTLWQGRPLYYTFSVDRLEMVQASDLDPGEVAKARQLNASLAPYWYSLPRWVWAPLPQDPQEREAIVASAVGGGDDVIQMPRLFQPWERGLPALREQLQPLDKQRDPRVSFFKAKVRKRMLAAGFAPDDPVTLPMTARGGALLAVFDRDSLRLRALLRTQD